MGRREWFGGGEEKKESKEFKFGDVRGMICRKSEAYRSATSRSHRIFAWKQCSCGRLLRLSPPCRITSWDRRYGRRFALDKNSRANPNVSLCRKIPKDRSAQRGFLRNRIQGSKHRNWRNRGSEARTPLSGLLSRSNSARTWFSKKPFPSLPSAKSTVTY